MTWPESSCHTMSDLPLPSKSLVTFRGVRPALATCKEAPGLLPIGAWLDTLVPFMIQPWAWPLVFCHRISDLPSPSMSAALTTFQLGPRLAPTGAWLDTLAPFISQI